MPSNPYSLVSDALWAMVEAHPDIEDLVRLGNRIKFNSNTDRDPMKSRPTTTDVPELILVSDGSDVNLYNTSSTSKIVKRYSWIISTGDMRANAFLFPVEWMLTVAHLGWKEVLTALEYPVDYHFVKRCALVSSRSGHSDKAYNRGLEGWSAVWTVDVEMHFKTADLKLELSP